MNERHIQYVLTIVQEGSFSAASKKLYVSQPSLSQTVKLIERDLGAEIFERHAKSLSITPAGKKYIEAARKIWNIQQDLQQEIARLNGKT